MDRILIFTGKGGVGKTSIAAAHARKSAGEGKKTLLFSADMAHNLSDLFEVKIGRKETRIAPELYALEADPEYMMEHEYRDMVRAVENLLGSAGVEVSGANDIFSIAGLPGMGELFSLLKILDLYEDGGYDRLIIDCAPTGETLALLKFPELLCWYMEKFFTIGKIAMRVLSPVSKALLKIELPDGRAMTDIERLYVRLSKLQELLKNDAVTTVRIVALPEKMVVEETRRNYMYLNLYGYYVDGVYINRVLPDTVENPFFAGWKALQGKYLAELEEVFGEVPAIRIPWYEKELCTMQALDRICREALEGRPVFQVQKHQGGEIYEKTEEGYRLSLFLPCACKDDLDLYQSEGNVILKVGNFKRNIALPDTLRRCVISGAKQKGDTLEIYFSWGGEQ